MSVQKLVNWIALSASISMGMVTISPGAELEIKQEGYLYQMPLTQNVYAETFVISPVSIVSPPEESTQRLLPTTPDPVAHFTNPVTVYFQIDSSEIDPGERNKMLSKIRALAVPQKAPLAVTGFTCQKGPAEFNIWLSTERAKAVATLLEKEGYTIAKIEGKGSSNLVSKNYPPFNRRVEIISFKN